MAPFWRNVTAQVAYGGSDGSEGLDELLGVLHEGMDDIPPLLFGSGEHGPDDSEILGAVLRAISAGDFLPQLHHARVTFGLIVGEGHIGIVQKPQYIVPAQLEAQEEIMADASWLAAAALDATKLRLGEMEDEALRHDGVVASLDAGDEARFEHDAPPACEICRVAGAAQQDLHLARPVLVVDVDQGLQFSQMMGVAQGMEHAFHRVVGLPVIMHHGANDVGP